MGARRTVRFAMGAWAVAGLLMLATSWPGPLAALLVVPYLAVASPFRNVSDAQSGRANEGWKRFLGINYAAPSLAEQQSRRVLEVLAQRGRPALWQLVEQCTVLGDEALERVVRAHVQEEEQ